MAVEYQATRREQAERDYECERCGARGSVVFGAVGTSGWHRESMFGTYDARANAYEAAAWQLFVDSQRVHRLIRCPTCKQRPPGAIPWACIRVGFWVALAVVLGVISGGEDGNAIWGAFLCAGVAIYFLWREVSRLARSDKAVFTKVIPGKPPAPRPRPESRVGLPVARAVNAPAAKPPVPPPGVEPPRAPAPAEPPPSPDGGPRFLRDFEDGRS